MISENIKQLKSNIPPNVVLVAVSKTKPNSDLMHAYEAGQRIFGENKIQEMTEKAESLPKDIQWHMIGHVQTNKVKFMAPFVALVHGVDSLKLLEEINKQAAKNNRVIDCLLQMHIAEEESKFGLDEAELNAILTPQVLVNLKNIRIKGLMGMATFTQDKDQIRKEFSHLRVIFDNARKVSLGENVDLAILSMGMSDDYEIAIECGSTMIRVGSRIFGIRN